MPFTAELAPWSVAAQNLTEHASNAIHTDRGARAAGFPSALVAGVTTYAYLTHPVVAAWGIDWLRSGTGEVRFRAPVLADDHVECVPSYDGTTWTVMARCPRRDDTVKAVLRLPGSTEPMSPPPPVVRRGEALASRTVELSGLWGADYGRRAGDDLDVYEREGIVHPAVWPAIANAVTAAELVRGSWIHTRSRIRHHALGRVGWQVQVHAAVIDRFERRGERAVLDVVVEHQGTTLVTIEHEAIVALPGS